VTLGHSKEAATGAGAAGAGGATGVVSLSLPPQLTKIPKTTGITNNFKNLDLNI
jgi:hypothetical protein